MEAERGVPGSGAVRSGWGCAPFCVRTSEKSYLLDGEAIKGKNGP